MRTHRAAVSAVLLLLAALLFAGSVSPSATEAQSLCDNLIAIDADETDDPGVDMETGGGSYETASIQPTYTVPVGVPFDVSIDIVRVGDPWDDYAAYNAVVDHAGLTFNPTDDLNGDTVNESWSYTGLNGMGFDITVTVPVANRLQGGSGGLAVGSDSGEALIANFTCASGGIKHMHLVARGEAPTYTTTAAPATTPHNTCLQDAVIICTEADWQVEKDDSPDPVPAGETLTYTITATNLGPMASRGLVIFDQLPNVASGTALAADTVFEDATVDLDFDGDTVPEAAGLPCLPGYIGTFPNPSPPPALFNNSVLCVIEDGPGGSNPSMAPGAIVTVDIDVHVPLEDAGTVVLNIGGAFSSDLYGEPDPTMDGYPSNEADCIDLPTGLPLDPENLGCEATSVTGTPLRFITLGPDTDTNLVGSQHTVTATVTENFWPVAGVEVSFNVSGANSALGGTCEPANCETDGDGQVSFTYTGRATGADTIAATATVDSTEVSDTATKTWLPGSGIIYNLAGGGVGDLLAATLGSLDGPSAVVMDGDGNLYVADSGHHRVRKISPSPGAPEGDGDGDIDGDADEQMTTVAGNGLAGYEGDGGDATEARLNTPIGLALDSAGNLYIVDSENHAVRRVSTSGDIDTVAGNGSPGLCDGTSPLGACLDTPEGVAVSLGVSGMDVYVADTANNRVAKVSGGTISTFVGVPLSGPTGLSIDGGHLYIGDTGNHAVRHTLLSGGPLEIVAGGGGPGSCPDGGSALGACLDGPTQLAADGGDVWIADSGNHRVVRVDSGGTLHVVAGDGSAGSCADDSSALGSCLDSPAGVARDGSGNVFIGNQGNNVVSRVTGGLIRRVAGTGWSGFCLDGVPAVTACLGGPSGMVERPNGDVIVADTANHRIRLVDHGTDTISTIVGTGTPPPACSDGGTPLTTCLNGPRRVALSGTTLYIADTENHRVLSMDLSSPTTISTVAGTGTQGSACSGSGAATTVSLNRPSGLAVGNGDLYIADTDNHCVRHLSGGNLTTVAGNGTAGACSDATGACLLSPLDVAVDDEGMGTLYVADSGNHRVVRVEGASLIAAAGVSETPGSGGDGGPAHLANLSSPAGIGFDSENHLLIADTGNDRVREVYPGSDGTVDGDTDDVIIRKAGPGTSPLCADASDPVGNGCQALTAFLKAPWDVSAGVAAADEDKLFIADQGHHRVRTLERDMDLDGLSDQVERFTTGTDPEITDTDSDGCADSEEQATVGPPLPTGYDPLEWYDFYDVPVPARADPASNGPRNKALGIGDVLAVLFYAGAGDDGPANGNGVDYDSDKDSDTVEDGLNYDRSPGTGANPPYDAGPPDGAISIIDVLVVVAQAGLDCSGPP